MGAQPRLPPAGLSGWGWGGWMDPRRGVLRGGAAHYEGVALGPGAALYLVSEPAFYQSTSRAVVYLSVGP